MREANVSTISSTANIIEGFGRASMLLHNGTRLYIKNTFYSPESARNLLSFKDIRLNGCHIETNSEGDKEYLNIVRHNLSRKCILEKLSSFSCGLYYTNISTIETHYRKPEVYESK